MLRNPTIEVSLLPDSGSPVYAMAELSLSPASGSPYPAGLASWSLQKAPYVSGPQLQGPSTYIPVIHSHQQSTPSVQPGWSTYHVSCLFYNLILLSTAKL